MAENRTFQLASGRTIDLMYLKQYAVYAGLLEGLPTRERNQRLMDRLIKEETSTPRKRSAYLIPAEQKPLEYDGEGDYPFGEPAALPSIVCIGRFRSIQPADYPHDISGLSIIWFQHDYAFPLDPKIADALYHLEWERYAVDDDD